MNRRSSGFTLIELLIVIGIVGILAAAAFSALNPAKRIGDSQDARRKSDLESIAKAIELYTADNGSVPSEIVSSALTSGNKYVLCSSTTTLTCNGQSFPCQAVTNTSFLGPYLAALPFDPTKTSAADTGYYVTRSNTNTLILGACTSYSSSGIQVASSVPLPTFASVCGNGILEGSELCDYTGTVCPASAGFYSGGFVYNGGQNCNSNKYGCNSTCSACTNQATCTGACAGGGTYSGGWCWYNGSTDADSCTTVCTDYSGCSNGSWNDTTPTNCALMTALTSGGCTSCTSTASTKAPYKDTSTNTCYYRSSGNGACAGSVGIIDNIRFCACNK